MNSSPVYDKKSNTRGAYKAMCGIGVVMLISKYASGIFSYNYSTFMYENNGLLQDILMRIIRAVSGKSAADSLVSAKEILSSQAVAIVVSMVIQMLTLFLPAFVFSKIFKKTFSECFNVKGKFAPGFVSFYFMVSLFMTACAGIANFFFDFLFPKSTAGLPSGIVVGQLDGITIFLTILSTAFFVPVIEEYVFRGVVLEVLRPFGTDFAVVASAFAFGVMHFNAAQSMYAFAFGIFSAMAVIITGNIKTSIAFHVLNNLSTVIMEFIMLYNPTACQIYSDIVLILTVILGFWGIWRFFSRDGAVKRYNASREYNDEKYCIGENKCGLKQLFAFPVIIFLSYYVLNVLVPMVM